MQLDLIDSSLRSSAKFSENLAVELSVHNDHEKILQRIHDYRRIIEKLTADQDDWTEQTTEDLLVQLESMVKQIDSSFVSPSMTICVQRKVEGLQEQLEEIRHSRQQLLSDIEDMANEYAPIGEDAEGEFDVSFIYYCNILLNVESDLTRLRRVLQSLSEFQQSISKAVEMETTDDILQSIEQYMKDRNRLQDFLNQPVPEKQGLKTKLNLSYCYVCVCLDVGSQASSDEDFYQQVQELLGVDEDDPEKILHLISELVNWEYQAKGIAWSPRISTSSRRETRSILSCRRMKNFGHYWRLTMNIWCNLWWPYTKTSTNWTKNIKYSFKVNRSLDSPVFSLISMVAKLDIVSLEEDHFHKSISQLLEKLDPSSG